MSYVRNSLLAAVALLIGGVILTSAGRGPAGSMFAAQAAALESSAITAAPVGTCTPTGTPTVLYGQTDNAGTTATSSQNFEPSFDSFDVLTADDLVIPGGEQWNISRVHAVGQYFNGTGPADSVNVFFYQTSGTLPSNNAICSFNDLVITSGAATGDFQIDLPGNCVLIAGTYWVSVQANMNFTPNGQWGWTDRTMQSNNAAAFENAGGGFMCSGGNGWVIKTTCVATTSPDQLFQIIGTIGAECGTPTPTATPTGTPPPTCGENFDSVTAPALPENWTTQAFGSESPWVTTDTITVDTVPNTTFAPDPNMVGDTWLISDPIHIRPTGGAFSFRIDYNTEATFDGIVLEISVNGGPYQDIISAGGSFVTGGYDGPISTAFMSPIGGRNAWNGSSIGYKTSTVALPAAANGQTINLKWRMASDSSVAGTGVKIDTISGLPCGSGTPTPTLTPTASPTNTPTNTPTATPTATATPTVSPTSTPTASPTNTPSSTPTRTPTNTPTSTPTSTPTNTPTATPTNTPTASPTGTPTATPTATPTIPSYEPRADFDGDGKSDLSVFRPSEGNWYYQGSTAGFTALHFGEASDIPAPGDFDGDHKTDISVFRPSNGFWYRINSSDGTVTFVEFGLTGDIPQAGDYDGDGKDDPAVFRPTNGTWYWLRSINNQQAGMQFGQNGDKPVGGDYDGDGKQELAVFRGGIWFRFNSADSSFTAEAFGIDTDIAVHGDYNGDNLEDIAVFRPSLGNWYFHNSGSGFTGVHWGQNGDIPVPADYDGDNLDDVAIYRDGIWYIRGSSTNIDPYPFGLHGDLPIPKMYIR